MREPHLDPNRSDNLSLQCQSFLFPVIEAPILPEHNGNLHTVAYTCGFHSRADGALRPFSLGSYGFGSLPLTRVDETAQQGFNPEKILASL